MNQENQEKNSLPKNPASRSEKLTNTFSDIPLTNHHLSTFTVSLAGSHSSNPNQITGIQGYAKIQVNNNYPPLTWDCQAQFPIPKEALMDVRFVSVLC